MEALHLIFKQRKMTETMRCSRAGTDRAACGEGWSVGWIEWRVVRARTNKKDQASQEWRRCFFVQKSKEWNGKRGGGEHESPLDLLDGVSVEASELRTMKGEIALVVH
ncbi:hypothetical protein KSF_103500 [Reticulibacter mediterranei]|uniref:Uncharacterized protein n=1 Tax=Reticulibacter mediterranei TaxID=2778369 RepID=A0A8J3J0W1_9CHLR|nr:hypothetical protein KSF_103500 [Reticulibacter mediterranei]